MKLKNVLFRLSCLCIAFFCLGSSSAQLEITSVGDDFWFGFMQNESTNVELSVFISSEQIATGVIEMPLTGWSESFVTTPGQTTTILVPLAAMNNTSGQIQDKGIHISSDLPISVYCINYQEFTADGTRIFPKQFLETEYVVSAYSGLSSLPSQLLVVGTEDGTEIVITPSCDMEGGFTTGVPFTIDLNQGDTYQLKASGFNADVSGTTVRSTEASGECRPFAVFGGAQCANIPNNCSACDHLFDQAIPTNVWGTQYYTVPLEGATSYTYRVTASEDNTDVMIDSVFAFTLNANEYEEVNFEEDPLYITGSTPILVAQYMEGSTCAGFGDPAFMTLNSANQTMDNVTFATVVSTIITDHNLNVVVASTAINEVFLDGTLVAASEFTAFPGNPAFSYAQLSITEGSHNLQCAQRFTAYVYGTGQDESYAYSVGANTLEDLEPVVNVSCSDGQVILQGDPSYLNTWWSTQSAPEDTVALGQPFVINPPILNEVYILHGSNFLSGCDEEEVFSVESPGEITVDIPEVTIDLCLDQEFTFTPTVDPPSSEYVYNWNSEGSFVESDVENGVIAPFVSGYYYLDVTSFSGCASGSDSVFVNIVGDEITSMQAIASPLEVCEGDTVFLDGLTGENLGSDFFEGGTSPGLWAGLQGVTFDQSCGSMSGDALYFNGGTDRYAETTGFDMTNGGTVKFGIQISDGSGACDGAEIGENVQLQYSINGGVDWTTFYTLYENFYPTFELLDIPVPTAAEAAATRFRWSQALFSAADEDIWMLDNVIIEGYGSTGTPYVWNSTELIDNPNIQSTFSIPAASGYFAIETELNGCSFTDSVFVDVQSNFELNLTNDTVLCFAQPLQLNATPSESGMYTFVWDNVGTLNNPNTGTPIAEPLVETVYSVEVTSSAGCVKTDSVLVTVLSSDNPTINAATTSICGGSVELEVDIDGPMENYQVLWSPANLVDDPTAQTVSATPSSTTIFEVIITDTVNSCTLQTPQVEITVNLIDLDLPNDTILCETEGHLITYDFTPSAFQDFSWTQPLSLDNASSPFPTITQPEFSDTLILIVDDAQFNCTLTDTVIVSHAPLIYLLADTLSSCQNASIQPTIEGSFASVVWTPSANLNDTDPVNPVFSLSEDETFYYTVSNSNDCSTTDSIFILINLPTSFELSVDTNLCDGGTVEIDNPLEGFDYEWSTNEISEDIEVGMAGTYTVTVTDSIGCEVSDSIDIISNSLPVFTIVGDSVACEGETITLNADILGVSYTWDNTGNTQFSDYSLAGDHIAWAEVIDNLGCMYRDSIELFFSPPPALELSASGAICEDTAAVITAEAIGTDFLWASGEMSPTLEVFNQQYYLMTVTDSLGCMTTDSIFVERIDFPNVAVADTFFCEGVSVNIIRSTGSDFSLSWSTGSLSDTLIVSTTGNYQMILQNENCVKKFPFEVVEAERPELVLSKEDLFCDLDYFGSGFPLTASSDGTVEWVGGSGQDNILSITEPGVFFATAYSDLGCTTDKQIEVTNQCLPILYVPSAFSPNNDGLNDQFRVDVTGVIDEYSLVIFNRWGETVFETDDPDAVWIGGEEGSNYYVPDGVYHYSVTYGAWTGLNEILKKKTNGHITVVR